MRESQSNPIMPTNVGTCDEDLLTHARIVKLSFVTIAHDSREINFI